MHLRYNKIQQVTSRTIAISLRPTIKITQASKYFISRKRITLTRVLNKKFSTCAERITTLCISVTAMRSERTRTRTTCRC